MDKPKMDKSMKSRPMISTLSIALAFAASALALNGCEVEKTEEGEMPEVEVEGGNVPEYDVEGPDVDVGTEERTITVPDVDVNAPEDEDEPDPDPR